MSCDPYFGLLEYLGGSVRGEGCEFFADPVPFGALVSAYDRLPRGVQFQAIGAVADEIVSCGRSVDDAAALVSVVGDGLAPAFWALVFAGVDVEFGDVVAALRASGVNVAQLLALSCLVDPAGLVGPVSSNLLRLLADLADRPTGEDVLPLEVAQAIGHLSSWLLLAQSGADDGPVFA